MPTIRLATHEDMRVQTSRTPLQELWALPFLYVATEDPEAMRVWGVAQEATLADFARLFPDALVSPKYAGEQASRGDLLYNGAEPAAGLLPTL